LAAGKGGARGTGRGRVVDGGGGGRGEGESQTPHPRQELLRGSFRGLAGPILSRLLFHALSILWQVGETAGPSHNALMGCNNSREARHRVRGGVGGGEDTGTGSRPGSGRLRLSIASHLALDRLGDLASDGPAISRASLEFTTCARLLSLSLCLSLLDALVTRYPARFRVYLTGTSN
jgi:hypothetical protein